MEHRNVAGESRSLLPPVPSVIIVADDVTGAADSAARCASAGLGVTIDLALSAGRVDSPTLLASNSQHAEHKPAPISQQDKDAQTTVWAISTDSRFLAPAQAAQQVIGVMQSVVSAHLSTGHTSMSCRWYKKIDSTLRGNIGAELAAMLPFVTPKDHHPHAIIAPAFPAQQRALVDGYLSYAQLPPRTHHLPTMLAQQCTLGITAIPLEKVRAGHSALCQALTAAKQDGTELIVADAEQEEDLLRIYLAAAQIIPHALLCGSAGFIGVWAAQLYSELNKDQSAWTSKNASSHHNRNIAQRSTEQRQSIENITIPERETISERTGTRGTVTYLEGQHPIVAVVGSGSTVAHHQLTYLQQQPSVTVIEVDPNSSAGNLATAIAPASGKHGTVPAAIVLHLPKPSDTARLEGERSRRYAAQLAQAAQALIAQIQPTTLLVVGGDTAVHLLERLGIRQLQVNSELLPGMPLTVGESEDGKTYQIILKAGNHGTPETLATLLGLHD